MKERLITQPQTVFDQSHYVSLMEARGETMRRLVEELKRTLNLATALDVGCGVGFFAKTLHDLGLRVCGFDGRIENVEEARRRYPGIPFEQGNIENGEIRKLGEFDLVLCFGLVYHLENPLAAMRHLRALTGKGLLLESMCFPEERPWMLLREEPSSEDQSLTNIAFYATEGCLVKMLYRAGFPQVYRLEQLPEHDDFWETREHVRRRTILFASPQPVSLPGLKLMTEPREFSDPWQRVLGPSASIPRRIKRFLRKPMGQKYLSLANRLRRQFPGVPLPLRLPFGAWWIAKQSVIDDELFSGRFESREMRFVARFLQRGMTVLDIGAHQGLYTLLASKCVGNGGRVLAFEPSPRERKQLFLHLRVNRCANVKVLPFALGNETSEAEFFLVDGNETGCNSLRPPAVNQPTHKIHVGVRRLDEVVRQEGVESVDFIKLDVEGGELAVLRGATGLLEGRPRPVILAEVQDIRTQPWGYQAKEIIQLLRAKGFRWFALGADGALEDLDTSQNSFDGNFVALPEELEAKSSITNSRQNLFEAGAGAL